MLIKKQLQNNPKFIEDLGADSSDAVEIVMAVEEEFELKFLTMLMNILKQLVILLRISMKECN